MSDLKLTPFVKWAGGKKQLLDKLLEKMPSDYNTYYEPFIGGGAVLLGLQPHSAVINDVNEQLLNVYHQIKSDEIALINKINELDSVVCDKDFYLSIRAKYNEKIQHSIFDTECAAYFIWINKHCFNGLYRVNSKGLFNVPYNNKQTGASIDEDNILNIANFLRSSNIKIQHGDFEQACANVASGDFVYFDSPYVPASNTANFTTYTKDGFSYDDHVRLADLFKKLDGDNVKLMLSNHNVPLVHELYEGYNIEVVDVRRNINSKANKRVGKEVIITNY